MASKTVKYLIVKSLKTNCDDQNYLNLSNYFKKISLFFYFIAFISLFSSKTEAAAIFIPQKSNIVNI